MTCSDCAVNEICLCGYSCNNAACITFRERYDALEKIGDYIYLYKNGENVAIYHPVIGLYKTYKGENNE